MKSILPRPVTGSYVWLFHHHPDYAYQTIIQHYCTCMSEWYWDKCVMRWGKSCTRKCCIIFVVIYCMNLINIRRQSSSISFYPSLAGVESLCAAYTSLDLILSSYTDQTHTMYDRKYGTTTTLHLLSPSIISLMNSSERRYKLGFNHPNVEFPTSNIVVLWWSNSYNVWQLTWYQQTCIQSGGVD